MRSYILVGGEHWCCWVTLPLTPVCTCVGWEPLFRVGRQVRAWGRGA